MNQILRSSLNIGLIITVGLTLCASLVFADGSNVSKVVFYVA